MGRDDAEQEDGSPGRQGIDQEQKHPVSCSEELGEKKNGLAVRRLIKKKKKIIIIFEELLQI